MPAWHALTGNQRRAFKQLSGRRGDQSPRPPTLSISSSATTTSFYQGSKHPAPYFVTPHIKPVHFRKVPIWLKLTSSQLALELHRPFGKGLQVGKHYSQYSKMCLDLTSSQRSRKIFCSSEETLHIGNDALICPIHPFPCSPAQEHVKDRWLS